MQARGHVRMHVVRGTLHVPIIHTVQAIQTHTIVITVRLGCIGLIITSREITSTGYEKKPIHEYSMNCTLAGVLKLCIFTK